MSAQRFWHDCRNIKFKSNKNYYSLKVRPPTIEKFWMRLYCGYIEYSVYSPTFLWAKKWTFSRLCDLFWPPRWSSGQSFWLQIQRSRVWFPALPDFPISSGSITGSTQPREVNWGAAWIKKVAAPVKKTEINGRGDPLRWPRNTPLSAKVGTNFTERRRPLCRYSSLAD